MSPAMNRGPRAARPGRLSVYDILRCKPQDEVIDRVKQQVEELQNGVNDTLPARVKAPSFSKNLTGRWHAATLSTPQSSYLMSPNRINYVWAGRRSFKTEAAKRRVVMGAITFSRFSNGQFFACAPTHQQAKDIFWRDLCALVPRWALKGTVNESISDGELRIDLANGACIRVAGLDKPQRIEGGDWDGGVIDEYAECKPEMIDNHIRPMMMRGGWLDLTSVPEGRNHFYNEIQDAKLKDKDPANKGEYGLFHWKTSEVLHLYLGGEAANRELTSAQQRMDPLSYAQEYDADFVFFEGRAYYTFDESIHVKHGIKAMYNPSAPLILCFDFNNAPGTCSIVQEDEKRGKTLVIDEVYIPKNSNTRLVSTVVLSRYMSHRGQVHLYGDASGGAKTSSAVDGSDWDLVNEILKPTFGDRLVRFVPSKNPPERSRVNAVNSRLMTATGKSSIEIDSGVRFLIHDLDSVRLVKGGSGQIDKDYDKSLTHSSDNLGYYIVKKWPTTEHSTTVTQT